MTYRSRSTPVRVDLRRTDASQGAAGERDTLVRVENVQGGSGDDQLTGDAQNNFMLGGEGDDGLSGETGRDQLFGEAGSDVLVPSPALPPFGIAPDGVSDLLDCGVDDDGQDRDLAFRSIADGDVADRCETVLAL